MTRFQIFSGGLMVFFFGFHRVVCRTNWPLPEWVAIVFGFGLLVIGIRQMAYAFQHEVSPERGR